jgi:hypothetical protein
MDEIPLPDDDAQTQQQMDQYEQEWLADEAAQVEYKSWLASTYTGADDGTQSDEASKQFRDDAGRSASRPVLSRH